MGWGIIWNYLENSKRPKDPVFLQNFGKKDPKTQKRPKRTQKDSKIRKVEAKNRKKKKVPPFLNFYIKYWFL